MGKPDYIELGEKKHVVQMPILYEDRSVIAIDKPPGWLLVPFSWQRTGRNLQAAITSSIAGGDFWARSRNLKFLRHVHRLDADTSGVLLFAKSIGGVDSYGDLFEGRRMNKTYLAVIHGTPKEAEWTCRAELAPDPNHVGKMRLDEREGKEAETSFRVVQRGERMSLVEARPVTGRTHQIRVHLLAAGLRIVGDDLYGDARKDASVRWNQDAFPLALRAVALEYTDPFTRRHVRIHAPTETFLRAFGFASTPRPA
ncbi:MAG TPA: RluA family pseudouridine synthase [Verrucomicrobiae bacterium]